jgi:ribonucleoside-diphosphate reductase alpha chain
MNIDEKPNTPKMYDSSSPGIHLNEAPGGGQNTSPQVSSKPMIFERYLAFDGKSPFQFDLFGNQISWISEEVNVTDDMGRVVYTQKDVKRPSFWSPLAIKVVASKYFWGDQNKGERESSVEQLIGRVSRFVGRQARKQGYFDEEQAGILQDEVSAICMNQLAVFNSPVWFNAGIQEYDKNAGGVSTYKWDSDKGQVVSAVKSDDRPQCSACFIQSIKDNMDSILEVQVAEANLFKAGSGTGTNRSPIRSSKERLTAVEERLGRLVL